MSLFQIAQLRSVPSLRSALISSVGRVRLGLNAFHGDSAAALIRDGKLIAAAGEAA